MRRYLSLLIGIAAILGSAYFLAMGLFAGVVIFFWAGKASPLALIVLLAATFGGIGSGGVAVWYFFSPQKVKFYHTFPSWLTVSLVVYIIFLMPLVNCIKSEREVRAYVEQNDRNVTYDQSTCSLNEAIDLLEKYPLGNERLRALEVIGKCAPNQKHATEIILKKIYQSKNSEARRFALRGFFESQDFVVQVP